MFNIKYIIFYFLISCQFILAESLLPQLYHFEWDYPTRRLIDDKEDSLITLSEWRWRTETSKWQEIKLPFYTDYKDRIILKTTFKAGNSASLELKSFGILGTAKIYLNGKFIHFQSNDHIAFDINLPVALIKTNTDNELEIYISPVNSTREGYPHVVTLLREKEYSGILRPVFITSSKAKVINITEQTLNFSDGKPTLQVQYQILTDDITNENTKRISIEEILTDASGNIIDRNGLSGKPISISRRELSFNIADNQLWSLDNPQQLLLMVNIKIGVRTVYSETFKLQSRLFTTSRDGFYLNHKPIDIHGINYHQNYGLLQNSKYYSTIRKHLSSIHHCGFNAVRFPHHVPDAIVYHLADSIGLLIFAELPIWRYPASLFSNDYLMEHAKNSIRNLADHYSKYASFISLGTGQEIPLNDPASQKFMLILKTLVKSYLKIPSYLSPVPLHGAYSREAADFYVLDLYLPIQSVKGDELDLGYPFQLCGKIGFLNDPQILASDPVNLNRKLFLSREINSLQQKLALEGGFIESFQDWASEYKSHITNTSSTGNNIVPGGLFDTDGQPKPEFNNTERVWDMVNDDTIYFYPELEKTNFFSILLFVALVIFLTISRKNKRLRENLKRSLKHPYGFFVDMRERRIIPLFNSILVGFFAALILSSGCASFFYFYRNSFGFQEVIASILVPLGIYEGYLNISHSLMYLTLTFTLIFLLYPAFISLILKTISFFTAEQARYRQGLAIGLWSGVPLFFLLPVSMISYQVIYYQNYENYILITLAVFVIWTHLRIINGIRVLFIAKPVRVFMIMLLSYMTPMLIFWAVFHPEFYWLDYLKLLLDARLLF